MNSLILKNLSVIQMGFCIPTGQKFIIIDVLLSFGLQQLTIQLFKATLKKTGEEICQMN